MYSTAITNFDASFLVKCLTLLCTCLLNEMPMIVKMVMSIRISSSFEINGVILDSLRREIMARVISAPHNRIDSSLTVSKPLTTSLNHSWIVYDINKINNVMYTIILQHARVNLLHINRFIITKSTMCSMTQTLNHSNYFMTFIWNIC